MIADRAIEHAAGSEAWLRHTLEEIVGQVRRVLDVTGVSFLVVDWEASAIRPAASWFSSDAVREAFVPVLTRPYDPARGGVTEAAIEGQAPVLIERFEDWPGAGALHRRLVEQLDPEAAARLWDWYSTSSFLSCPVRTSEGQIIGVLAIARSHPRPAFGSEDLRVTGVLADLAALAIERSRKLDDEERRGRDEVLLHRAAQEIARSLEPGAVTRAIAAQARVLTGAAHARVTRVEPGAGRLTIVATAAAEGAVAAAAPASLDGAASAAAPASLDEAALAAAARTGAPQLRDGEAHVPILLGARVYGVVSVAAGPRPFAAGAPERLLAFAPAAAIALANALDFERERRVAGALTAGFIPESLREPVGHELGLVYEPAGREVSGGDAFGVWSGPDGGLWLLVGDVSGKGLEVAATAAMVRFFVEARAYDRDGPAEVLAQVNAMLRGRLAEGLFVPAFLARIDGHRLRWCNAGHPPPQVLRAGGGHAALGTTGLPLGVDAGTRYEERECELGAGDVLVAATDGLWEARRDGAQFGDTRLAEVLAEYGLVLGPQSLARRLRDEAARWAPHLDDDLVVLVVRARA